MMSLTSNGFLLFTIGSVLLYYLLPRHIRWIGLLAASLVFYGAGGLKALNCLLFSMLLTYACGYGLSILKKKHQRQILLIVGIFFNLGLLMLAKRGGILGQSLGMPLGISFYIFQTTGYLADVYSQNAAPERNPAKYALFVSFFPQIFQGPIGRWNRLSSQLFIGHPFAWENIGAGLERMVWGFFKKMVIADWAAVFVDPVFAHPEAYRSLTLFAVFLYSVQLYANFSGGIDVALGIATLFGIRLDENFQQPYFATSIRDFWRRWHITLSSWLRDYIYIPLGGNRKGQARACINLLLTFIISGIWHGTGRTFLVWGLLHGVYQIAAKITSQKRQNFYHARRITNRRLFRLGQQVTTFLLVSFSWIFFRADSLSNAFEIIRGLKTLPDAAALLTIPAGRNGLSGTPTALGALAVGIILFFFVDLWKEKNAGKEQKRHWPLPVRFSTTILLLLAIGAFGSTALTRGFIYAQF